MEKQLRIITNQELKLINEYIIEQNFYKNDTQDEIRGLFLVMVGHGIEPEKAILNIGRTVSAIKNEY